MLLDPQNVYRCNRWKFVTILDGSISLSPLYLGLTIDLLDRLRQSNSMPGILCRTYRFYKSFIPYAIQHFYTNDVILTFILFLFFSNYRTINDFNMFLQLLTIVLYIM